MEATNPQIAALILAAGSSSRMGQPKQLLDWSGQPLVRVVASHALASNVTHTLVVIGQAEAAVRTALAGLDVAIVANPAFASGQSSSLICGLNALPKACAAVLVLLGDQPFIRAEIINTIIDAWATSKAAIVVPIYAGQRGHPALFDRQVLSELYNISGDQGARQVIQANPERVLRVAIDDTRPLEDIDTPADYARLTTRQNR